MDKKLSKEITSKPGLLTILLVRSKLQNGHHPLVHYILLSELKKSLTLETNYKR